MMERKLIGILLTLVGLLAIGAAGEARATTFTSHFTGVIAPTAWGLPVPSPTPGSQPGPGPVFPPPPIVVILVPLMGHFASNQGPSASNSGVLVMLTILMSDPTGLPTFIFNGTSTSADFRVNRLTTATLTATVQGFDAISQSPKTITVTVSWTGMGDATHIGSATRFRQAGFSIVTEFSGRLRMAVATGSLSGDVNADLGASTGAFLSRAEDGTVLKIP